MPSSARPGTWLPIPGILCQLWSRPSLAGLRTLECLGTVVREDISSAGRLVCVDIQNWLLVEVSKVKAQNLGSQTNANMDYSVLQGEASLHPPMRI